MHCGEWLYLEPHSKHTQSRLIMCSATLSPGMSYPNHSLCSRFVPSIPTISHAVCFGNFSLQSPSSLLFFDNFTDKLLIFHLRLAQLPLGGNKLRYLLPQQLLTQYPFLQGVLVPIGMMFSSLVPGTPIHPFNHLFNSTNIC